ncbi:hypothetical protein DFH06DRAFT_1146134 [Mycena polygramma]|nr:hypothetical protein DFH06DRAFT_1146134 [Mycena polygramma]
MQGSEGAEASDEVPEEPKHLTNQSREATGKTEANARMFGRVPMARAAEAEHDRKESPNGEMEEAEKAMKPKLQRVPNGTRSRWKISERKDEPEGAEQFPAKGCRPELKCTEPEKPKSRMSLSEARPRSGMAGQDPGTRWQKFSDRIPTENIGCGWPKAMHNLKTATVFGRCPDPSSERKNGKETANGGEQPRTIPDASAEASIGRSEVTNGRLGSGPRKGDEQRTEGRSRGYPKCRDEKMSGERVPERKAKMNECRRGMDVGERKLLGGMNREVGRDSEAKQQGTSDRIPTEDIGYPERVREFRKEGNSRRAARRGGNGKHQRCESGGRGSAEQNLKSSAEGNDASPEDPDKSRRVECSLRTRNPEVNRAKLRSNHIPTEIFGDIRICGGFKAVTQPTSCSNTPEVFGTKAKPRPRVPRGMCREGEGNGNGKQQSC